MGVLKLMQRTWQMTIYGLGKLKNNRGLKAISLSSNASFLTISMMKDEYVYSKQLETLESGRLTARV